MATATRSTVETVDLADIRDDETWPTDPEDVEGFRASIRAGRVIWGGDDVAPVTLNRVWQRDGSFHYEIIDGFHRTRACRLEGVAQIEAKIYEVSARDAEILRARACMNRERKLLNLRAIQAIRQCFVRDVQDMLSGAQLFEPVIDEDGAMCPVPLTVPVPGDPLMALGVLYDHFSCQPSDMFVGWEQRVSDWLDEICSRFGKSREWLRDEILGISALVEDGVPGKNSVERARLLALIPDRQVREMVRGRLKREPKLTDARLRFALDWLGCGTDVGTVPYLTRLSSREMRTRLTASTLDQLAGLCLQAVDDYYAEQKRRAADTEREIQPQWPSQRPAGAGNVSDAVFGIASSRFAGTPQEPDPQNAPPDLWLWAHTCAAQFLSACQAFEQRGGDWARVEVRADLSMILERVQTLLAGGASRRGTL